MMMTTEGELTIAIGSFAEKEFIELKELISNRKNKEFDKEVYSEHTCKIKHPKNEHS